MSLSACYVLLIYTGRRRWRAQRFACSEHSTARPRVRLRFSNPSDPSHRSLPTRRPPPPPAGPSRTRCRPAAARAVAGAVLAMAVRRPPQAAALVQPARRPRGRPKAGKPKEVRLLAAALVQPVRPADCLSHLPQRVPRLPGAALVQPARLPVPWRTSWPIGRKHRRPRSWRRRRQASPAWRRWRAWCRTGRSRTRLRTRARASVAALVQPVGHPASLQAAGGANSLQSKRPQRLGRCWPPGRQERRKRAALVQPARLRPAEAALVQPVRPTRHLQLFTSHSRKLRLRRLSSALVQPVLRRLLLPRHAGLH